jgi:hypothetical protein
MAISLKNITQEDYNDIKQLTQLKSVMKYVGNGKIWDERKINNFIKYGISEAALSDSKRDYYYYKIVNTKQSLKTKSKSSGKGGAFIGIIGFHKFPELRVNKDFYLTIFIHPKHQGKGYFTQSIDILVKKIKKHKPHLKYLVSLTHSNNQSMNDISRVKFTYDKYVGLGGAVLNKYLLFLDLPLGHYKKQFYLVKSNYLKKEMVRSVYDSINKTHKTHKTHTGKHKQAYWEEYNINSPQMSNPTFLYLDGNYIQNKIFRKLKPSIKNLVDDGKYTIANKEDLFNNLAKIQLYNKSSKSSKSSKSKSASRSSKSSKSKSAGRSSKSGIGQVKLPFYLKPQINVDLSNLTRHKYETMLRAFEKGKVWIIKPVDGFAGKGIQVLENRSKLTSYLKDIKRDGGLSKYKKWVLQEYITNPLLFKNRKFHIRAYFLYLPKGEGYLLDISKIFIAGKDYVDGDYQNQSIHDTHLKSTPNPLYFERDFTKEFGKKETQNVKKQMIKIFKDVFKCIDGQAKCYSESKECFEMFGADLMIDADFVVKLIEVNTKIGLGSYPGDKIDINKIIFENLMDVVLGRCQKGRFIKL